MGLARPYFDRNFFKPWSQDRLIDELVEAKTRVMELQTQVRRLEKRIEETQEPYN